VDRHGAGLDSELTERGHDQAALLGDWLRNRVPIDAYPHPEFVLLCTSPLLRARQTAAYLSGPLALPALTQADLSEAAFHVASHLPAWQSPHGPCPPFIASDDYLKFKEQARSALDWMIEQSTQANGSLLAVTHGGFIKTLLRVIAATDSVCFRLYNAGLTSIEWRRGRWHLVHLNLCDHLPAPLRSF
jgi:probable phosphoglycerate mutase